jgi:molybdenum cofactor biosynthesis enzyme MoaA
VKISRQVGTSNKTPVSLHCLVTTECDLKCEGCFYVRGTPGAWEWDKAKKIVQEAAELGIQWLAIGGGEPTQWPHLDRMCHLARDEFDMRVAVTTNGMSMYSIYANAVHISYDERHISKWPELLRVVRIGAMGKLIAFHRKNGVESVGINTALYSAHMVEPEVLRMVDSITLMLDKPFDPTYAWEAEFNTQLDRCTSHTLISADSCLAQLRNKTCGQGRLSMSMDQNYMVSACSNCINKVGYTDLKTSWEGIRCRSEELPISCILT